jgi:hypothetical protein
VSIFADIPHVGLLVAMSGAAAVSGWELSRSVEERDGRWAWVWGAVFGATSLAAALSFGRLV